MLPGRTTTCTKRSASIVQDKGYKNVVIVTPNYPGGKDAVSGFKRYYATKEAPSGGKGKVAEEVYTKLGQLDYAAELAQIRSIKPDALFFFLPGGMGINFVKQFVAAGLSRDTQLFAPGFSADEDVIKAVGAPMMGMFNSSHWAHDMDNAGKQVVSLPISRRNTAACLRSMHRRAMMPLS
jgi:branched-chain amino acid transport system substrate-binding protein